MVLVEIDKANNKETRWIIETPKCYVQMCYERTNDPEKKKDLKLILDNWHKGIAYKRIDKSWLRKQFESAKKDFETWPKWMHREAKKMQE